MYNFWVRSRNQKKKKLFLHKVTSRIREKLFKILDLYENPIVSFIHVPYESQHALKCKNPI